jgi:anti-anti-sigma factor
MMMERTLTIEIEAQHPVAILKLGGFMAQLEVYKLKSQIDKLFTKAFRFLVFDFRNLSFIDSAGIGVMMQLRAECQRNGGQLVLVKPTAAQVNQALAMASIYKVLDACDDTETALEELRKKHGLVKEGIAAADAALVQDLAAQIRKLEETVRGLEARVVALEGRRV